MRTVLRATMRASARRLAGTGLAVCLGVAFLAGTLLLSDTLRANFDRLFATALGRADVVVRQAGALDTDVEAAQGLVDTSLAGVLSGVEGVRAVEPRIEGFGQLTGSDGKKLGGAGPPTLAGSWVTDPDLNPYELAEGRAPEGPDEVVVNRGAAEDGDLAVGDVTAIATPEPLQVTIVGIATFGGEDGLGPTTFAGFSLAGAEQHITGRPGQATSLLVAAEDGVDAGDLQARVAAALPDGVEAITGADLAAEASEDIDADFLGFLRGFLLAFALVALLVATFSIHNTFAIVVAQRSREAALLRAVGAERRQVLAATVGEAALVGLVASVVGVAAGIGLAGLLKGLFDAFGFALPAGGLDLRPTTLLLAPAVGVAVSVLAAAGPAVRASRVAPLAALRGAELDRTGVSPSRALAGAVLAGGGAVTATAGAVAGAAGLAGAGAAALLVGAIVLGPVVAVPAGRAIAGPLTRLRGVTGAMAGRNAVRSPRRTAATASALLIGVGVVTLFTVVATSLKTSFDRRVGDVVSADLLITSSQFGGGGLSPGLAGALGAVPEVETATGMATGPVAIGGETKQVSVVDPAALPAVLDLSEVEGDLAGVGDGALAVSDDVAERQGWSAGSRVDVTFPDGRAERMEVAAVYETAEPVLAGYLIPRPTWARHAVQTVDNRVLIALRDGAGLEAGRAAVEEAAAPFSPPEVQTKDEYVTSAAANIDAMLGLVYAMLALAVVIALMGIANTLSLSIHERVRELGLLRAVGQSRGQARSMVRWEAVAISLLGTTGGVLVGLFLGWALVEAVSAGGTVRFSPPVAGLVPIVAVGGAAGVLAAVRPARRAARLPVVAAVAAS